MKLSEILRIAWEGISRNKLRALLTMLGVIIGVAAVIIMIAISAGTEATIAENSDLLAWENDIWLSRQIIMLPKNRLYKWFV